MCVCSSGSAPKRWRCGGRGAVRRGSDGEGARPSGGPGIGSCVSPSRYRSTAAAAARPSAIAQTMSDWPRPASPATNTPASLRLRSRRRGRSCRARRTAGRAASLDGSVSGPVKPRARSTRSAGISRSVPAFGTRRPSRYSVSATRMARTSPASFARNSTVEARYSRSPPSSWALCTSNSVGCIGHGWWLGRALAAAACRWRGS